MFLVGALAQKSLSSTLRKKSTANNGKTIFHPCAVPTPKQQIVIDMNAKINELAPIGECNGGRESERQVCYAFCSKNDSCVEIT